MSVFKKDVIFKKVSVIYEFEKNAEVVTVSFESKKWNFQLVHGVLFELHGPGKVGIVLHEELYDYINSIITTNLDHLNVQIKHLELKNYFPDPKTFQNVQINELKVVLYKGDIYPIGYFQNFKNNINKMIISNSTHNEFILKDAMKMNLNELEISTLPVEDPSTLLQCPFQSFRFDEEFHPYDDFPSSRFVEICKNMLCSKPRLSSRYSAGHIGRDYVHCEAIIKEVEKEVPGGKWKWSLMGKCLCYDLTEETSLLVFPTLPATLGTSKGIMFLVENNKKIEGSHEGFYEFLNMAFLRVLSPNIVLYRFLHRKMKEIKGKVPSFIPFDPICNFILKMVV